MSHEIIVLPLIGALIFGLWDRHTILIILGPSKTYGPNMRKNREKIPNLDEKTSLE